MLDSCDFRYQVYILTREGFCRELVFGEGERWKVGIQELGGTSGCTACLFPDGDIFSHVTSRITHHSTSRIIFYLRDVT